MLSVCLVSHPCDDSQGKAQRMCRLLNYRLRGEGLGHQSSCIRVYVCVCVCRRLAPLVVQPEALAGLHEVTDGDCVVAVSASSSCC